MNSIEFKSSIKEISKFIGDDPVILEEILEVFLETSEKDLGLLYSAVYRKDVKECSRIAHKLYSTYSYFTGSGISEVMSLIEQNMALGKQTDIVSKLLSQKKKDIKKIESHVEKYLIHLRSRNEKNTNY